jgi:hypothetical protein
MGMTGSFTWSPEFEELKQALALMPEHLTAEADHLLEDAANGAAVAVRQVYGQHRVTGYLQNHVHVTQFLKGKFAPGYHVKSNSPHAWLFDNGSQARHKASGASTGQMWGATPPTHVFVNTMSRFRRRLFMALRGVLERAGLIVSGEERAA